MARNIALELTLNGVQKSISSLQEFEKELLAVQEELGIMSADSTKAFDTVSTEITQVNKDFEMLSQNISDVDFTNTVDQFTQVGDSITETFGQAQGAIQEFGNETKEVGAAAEKAMDETKKSAGGLTGALQDMGEKFSQIPGPVGQLAQGITGLGQAFKILIANPVGLFLAGIAVVFTTLYKALTSTEEGLFKFRELFASLSQILNPVIRLLQDIALVLVDGVLKGITLVQNGLEKLGFGVFAQASRDARELARAMNEVEAAEGDLNVARAKQNKELAEAREIISDTNLALAERQAALQRVKKSEEDLAQREVQLAEQRLKNIREEIRQKGASEELNTKEENALIALYNTQQNQAAVRRKNIKAEQALNREDEAERKRIASERAAAEKEASDARKARLEEERKIALELFNSEIAAIKSLRELANIDVPEPVVISKLRDTVTVYDSLVQSLGQTKPLKELLADFEKLPPPIDEAVDGLDGFGQKYDQIRKQLVFGALSDERIFKLISNRISDEFSRAFNAEEITKEAFDAFQGILGQYGNFNKSLQKLNELAPGFIFDTKTFLELTKTLKIASGEIVFDLDENGKLARQKTTKTYREALNDLQTFEAKQLAMLSELYKKTDPEGNVKEQVEKGKELIKNLETTSSAVIKQEENIEKFYATSIELGTQRNLQRNKALAGLLAQNLETVLNDIVNSVGIADELAEEQFDALIRGLFDFSKLTQEELDAITILYQEFYKKLNEYRKQDADDEKAKQQEKREAILNTISSLSGALGEASNILSSFSSLALERLAAEEEEALDSIVGTNEQANQKRLELAQQYEGQRRQIEKQTRIQELEFARVQAIADGAVAIIRAASTPILIPITTALVAAQVGLISAQISQARSLQRGGLLQMGGLLEGPSHEEGGIRFGQMGIELEGGEAVINRVSTAQYGSLLSTINQAGGGRPLVTSNFDDSRLLEALAKQRSEPIRAYVLEQEITNKQAVSSRLEALSTL